MEKALLRLAERVGDLFLFFAKNKNKPVFGFLKWMNLFFILYLVLLSVLVFKNKNVFEGAKLFNSPTLKHPTCLKRQKIAAQRVETVESRVVGKAVGMEQPIHRASVAGLKKPMPRGVKRQTEQK
jgi:hypothetical protein